MTASRPSDAALAQYRRAFDAHRAALASCPEPAHDCAHGRALNLVARAWWSEYDLDTDQARRLLESVHRTRVDR